MSGLGEASFQYELPRQAFFMLVGMVTCPAGAWRRRSLMIMPRIIFEALGLQFFIRRFQLAKPLDSSLVGK